MAHPTAVILIVGLTEALLGEHAPNLRRFRAEGHLRHLKPALPAVTCSVQASMVTGLPPREHGIVGNGWYNRQLAEVQFWKQSNRLVGGEKVWETARKRVEARNNGLEGHAPSGSDGVEARAPITCANLFWWYNMHSTVDYSVTPRPIYKADGRKIPDCYTEPPDLRDALQSELGRFPLFQFWGPGASIESSRWIADAARIVYDRFRPTLNLVYLPHLDYALQKHGPSDSRSAAAVREIDAVAGSLIEHYRRHGVRVMIVSEYGIEAVNRPIHINRILREYGAIRVRMEEGLEMLDPGASDCFAVADHQVAHVYVRDPSRVEHFRDVLRQIPGVEHALDRSEQARYGLDHERSGEVVLIAAPGAWFTYYWWLDDAKAPDFARTVDIHRKPGYDPCELFLDPTIRFPRAAIGRRLLLRRLGFRTPLDVIPLDATLVRGSHGRIDTPSASQPILLTEAAREVDDRDELPCTAIRDVILSHLFD